VWRRLLTIGSHCVGVSFRMIYALCVFVMGACCGDCRPFDGLHWYQFMNDLCSVYVCDGRVAEIVDHLDQPRIC